MQGGMLGLEPVGPGGYWLAPFWERKRDRRNVTMIVDYRGLMGMARRTKEVKVVDWREVRVGDKFEYEYGSQGGLRHVPAAEPIHVKDGDQVAERAITHFYAYGILTSGAMVFEVMRREDVEWHRDRYSKAAGAGPWVTAFAEMGAKTCVRKLADKLPFDPLLSRAVEVDMKTETGSGEDFAALLGEIGEGPGNGGTKLDKLTQELKKDGEPKSAPGGEAPAKAETQAPAASSAPAAPVAETAGPERGETSAAATRPTTRTPRAAGASATGSTAQESRGGGAPSADQKPLTAAQSVQSSTNPAKATSAGGKSSAPPAQSASSVGDPRVEGARQPSGGASISKLMDRVNQLYDDLDLAGTKNRMKRDWLWGRMVGAGVKVEDASPEKVQNLIAELERLVANKKKNGKK